MLYYMYELNHAAVAPWRSAVNVGRYFWKNPANPMSSTQYARSITAPLDMFERLTRRYGKPEFGIDKTVVNGLEVPVEVTSVLDKPFCSLLRFERKFDKKPRKSQRQKLLIVAPMSGHYATLLRGTVEDMLPYADVYITDWVDARLVPLSKGTFDLDDYIDYVIEMLQLLGPGSHVMAVCQPSVPVLAAVSLMSEDKDPNVPATMTLMGGPIDTQRNPTVVNNLAVERGTDWFRNNVIVKVPFPHAGFMRSVYPGFLQLTGFMTMNLDRHIDAHRELFWHMVEGDGDSAEKHHDFYDEYMSVMDLTAEFYLQSVERVFVNHDLPNGTFNHRGRVADPSTVKSTALMTVEGERDDISGLGQTEAAHDLCFNLKDKQRVHHVESKVGHYGVFNGRRFQANIAPRIVDFMRSNMH